MGDDGADDVPVDRRTLRKFGTAIRAQAETSVVVARHDERLEALEEETAKLRRVVLEGNGRSHATRLEIADGRLDRIESDLRSRGEAHLQTIVADRTGRWGFRAAALTLVGGIVAALITSIFALLQANK